MKDGKFVCVGLIGTFKVYARFALNVVKQTAGVTLKIACNCYTVLEK